MVFMLDDDWDNDPRVSKAGTAAFGLYTRCGMWVARHLTDGFVPAEIATSYGTREWAGKLVDVGLWQIREDGFQMPDYLVRNPTAQQQGKRREQYAERQKRWREKQGKKGCGSNASHNASHNASPAPSPKGEGRGAGAASRPAPHPYQPDGYECTNCNLPEQHGIHQIRLVGEAS